MPVVSRAPAATQAAPAELPFTAPALLAPMEGVTEPCFRDLVASRNPSAFLGGTFTEFARVSQVPLPARVLRAHLAAALPARPGESRAPVGLQLMGPRSDALAETARRAEEVGAPLVDLNFGCPAKGALRSCAGSALLEHPERIEELVSACVQAVQRVPVTAKIRAGGEDDARLEEICHAVEAGGASLLTVHCRTRSEGYRGDGDWQRLRRAVSAVSIPVCGNGGVERHGDLQRLRDETGCRYVMVGRAALADPWIFSGHVATRAEAVRFLLDYAELLRRHENASSRKVAGRLKQLIGTWRAGSLFSWDREHFLRERETDRLLARIAGAAAERRAAVDAR